MIKLLTQLRADLMDALNQYRQLFKDHPMPATRCQDIAKLTAIIQDESYLSYHDCIKAVESYLAKIKTIWWPLRNKSRLRDSLQLILDDYRHPDIQSLINRIRALQHSLSFHQTPIDDQPHDIFTHWIKQLTQQIDHIECLKNTFLKIRADRNLQQKTISSFNSYLHYLVKHPANECL